NLALYLKRQDADPAIVLAHCLAAATLRLQVQSGSLRNTVRNLASVALPDAPPPFADVVAQVEVIAGMRFGALFERLPRTAPDGDSAIAMVWQLVQEERQRQAPQRQQQEAAFTQLLAAIAAAATDEGLRAEIEPKLADLATKGWMLQQPVQRIW